MLDHYTKGERLNCMCAPGEIRTHTHRFQRQILNLVGLTNFPTGAMYVCNNLSSHRLKFLQVSTNIELSLASPFTNVTCTDGIFIAQNYFTFVQIPT